MLCVTITDTSNETLAAAEQADMVELRLDHVGVDGWKELASSFCKPVIVTYRKHDQGGAPGMKDIAESDRLAVLADALQSEEAAYVDVEFGCHQKLLAERKALLVLSHHDFEGSPRGLTGLCKSIADAGADVVKVVVTAKDSIDQMAVYRATRAIDGPSVILAMGEEGLATRLLGLRDGAAWSYAAPASDNAVAPGQIPVDAMRDLYRSHRLSKHTAVYAVMGDPILHSMSPAIHNAAFEAEGIDAVYVPLLVHGDPAELIREFKEFPFSGYSVTIPHKSAVMAAMDWIDPLAERIGAMNTVVLDGGELRGYNTDCLAAIGGLERASAGDGQSEGVLEGKRAVVLGAGGAARAIAFGLVDRGADVTLCNRTVSRAETLANELGCASGGLDDAREIDFEILVNATPVGMYPKVDASPLPAAALREGAVVFDTVYNPLDTRLLKDARARGCRTLDGLSMFVGQGAAQFELWTGRPAPVEVMRQVCLDRLEKR